MSNFKYNNINRLVSELKNGDRNAFRLLFNYYKKNLYLYIFKFLKSKDLTEDIIQEVFIKIWTKKGTLDINKDFTSLLYIIARNKIYDCLRKDAKRKLLVKNYTIYKAIYYNNIWEELKLKEYKSKLKKIISGLSKQKQKIYYLSRKEDKSNQEIAKILCISNKTVKNNLWEIMKYIKLRLKPHLED